MNRTILMLAMMMGTCATAVAQDDGTAQDRSDAAVYQKVETPQRTAPAYPALREADVIYAKRIERVIDSREKKNQIMNWPKSALNKILYNLVTTGEPTETGKLKAYATDSMDQALTVKKVKEVGASCETVQIQRPGSDDIYDLIDTTICTQIDPSQIKRWQITEEWIFDKQRSMFFPRIIAIAPLYHPMLNGVALDERPMFYINYAEVKQFLANKEVFNRGDDAMRLTYFDFFEQRMFSSYITKEENDKDFAIKDFEEFKNNPTGALYDSERIKNDMFNWEHDLWEY